MWSPGRRRSRPARSSPGGPIEVDRLVSANGVIALAGALDLAAQHRDLVAQYQQFHVLGAAVPGELGQHMQDLTQRRYTREALTAQIIAPIV